MPPIRPPGVFLVSDREVSPERLVEVSLRGRRVDLSRDARWRARVKASRAALERALAEGIPVYGVSTGVGGSSWRRIARERQDRFALAVMRQHGCGAGEPLGEAETRAMIFARLVCLAKGCSAVRLDLLEALCRLLNHRITPLVPRFGSVGASGDLTPLSYVAAALAGEREARFDGKVVRASTALRSAGLRPFRFSAKETLALMNGTSAMTGLAILNVERMRRIAAVSERATALAAEVLRGRTQAFHPTLHALKPHPGQVKSASEIRRLFRGSRLLDPPQPPGRPIQDPYSIRCAPHVIGSVRDGLDWAWQVLRIELNGVNDNPIVDPGTGEVIFGGNFYGGHIALGMDLLKIAAASLADLADRQFALLVDAHRSMGLPETLVGYDGNGVKGLQITCSALAALAIQRSAPDTTLSRPTECGNQDKVSMGFNAALNAAAVIDSTGKALAAELIALSNAAHLRGERGFSSGGATLLGLVRRHSPLLRADRRLDVDLARLAASLDDTQGS